jgi:predicted metal-dependent phosphoesterase TrpH
VRIDLHVHSSERSACALSGEEEMVRSAISFGLDGLVFTDHHRLMPADRAAELSEKFTPFRVFRGIECSVAEEEDIVVIGAFDPRLETPGLAYAEVHAIARDQGGFLILAHPFRYHEGVNIDLDLRPTDAIELHSISICGRDEPRIRQTIQRVGARTVHDSDAHRAEHVGIFHNRLRNAPGDERELVALLKAGAYECCRREDRIARRNREVEAEERRILDCIARGYDGKRFREETGGSMDHFVKVRRGGSYLL